MKTTLHYSARMTLCVHALGITSQIDLGWEPLEETLEYIDCIFNDATMFHAECVDWVHIIDSTTGELIAECEPNLKHSDENDYDPDWDYNEDMEFRRRRYYIKSKKDKGSFKRYRKPDIKKDCQD